MSSVLVDEISTTVNDGTTITKPDDKDIYIVAASHTFTANGVAVANTDVTGLNLNNHPLRCTTDVTGATVGTIFYFLG